MRAPDYCQIDRRRFMTRGLASLSLWSLLPRIASAAGSKDPRLLVVILRGGLDGLATVAPIGDPDYLPLRGEIALRTTGDGAALPLDATFALNAAMPGLHALYRKQQALFVHAAHTPYRERSHFDGQDVLESGREAVGRNDDGWLNRALQGLPSAGRAKSQGPGRRAHRAAHHARRGTSSVVDPEGGEPALAGDPPLPAWPISMPPPTPSSPARSPMAPAWPRSPTRHPPRKASRAFIASSWSPQKRPPVS